MPRTRKKLPPAQLGLELLEGANILARVTVWADDRRLLARLLREMANVIDAAARETELTPADLKTVLKFLPD